MHERVWWSAAINAGEKRIKMKNFQFVNDYKVAKDSYGCVVGTLENEVLMEDKGNYWFLGSIDGEVCSYRYFIGGIDQVKPVNADLLKKYKNVIEGEDTIWRITPVSSIAYDTYYVKISPTGEILKESKNMTQEVREYSESVLPGSKDILWQKYFGFISQKVILTKEAEKSFFG